MTHRGGEHDAQRWRTWRTEVENMTHRWEKYWLHSLL